MNIHDAFPSNYLKVADLGGREVTVVITGIQEEDMGDDRTKPVLYFAGKRKGMVLNRTNAETIADAYGENTDAWINKPIIIYPAKTQFKGQMTPCIRVRVQIGRPVRPAPAPAPAPPPEPAPAPAELAAEDQGDDIPF